MKETSLRCAACCRVSCPAAARAQVLPRAAYLLTHRQAPAALQPLLELVHWLALRGPDSAQVSQLAHGGVSRRRQQRPL